MRARRFVLFALALTAGWVFGDAPSFAAEITAQHQMIAAANPHAARAGLKILRAGGSAVDAAVAVQMVLTLVEPQSSGIGGGAFMLHYEAAEKRVQAYDGRETAPKSANGDLFLKADGTPLKFFEALVGGRAVGVPGVPAMLALAHRNHGKLSWAELFAPAIELAEQGFAISPRLFALLKRDKHLPGQPAARRYFYDAKGEPRAVGEILRNPELAATLRTLAQGGAKAFYRGPIAKRIVEAVRNHANPGGLTEVDMAAYKALIREAVCRTYRKWRICGMPPPTSGGLTTLQILALLEGFDLGGLKPGSLEAVHLISEASRLAYADRGLYMADADFVTVPSRELLSPAYVAERARLIDPARAMSNKAQSGDLAVKKGRLVPGLDAELPSTTHFSIVDRDGNVVSMTSSVENAFGSRLMVAGFILNNQLTDFSFRPEKDGRLVANRVEPGKRPRSSVSPTLVFDGPDGAAGFRAAVGSPGGSRIIAYVIKTLIALLDWKLTPAQAVALPHHVNRNRATDLEADTTLAELAEALKSRGHKVRVRSLNSGLHVIARTRSGYSGGADPRREGIVLGD